MKIITRHLGQGFYWRIVEHRVPGRIKRARVFYVRFDTATDRQAARSATYRAMAILMEWSDSE